MKFIDEFVYLSLTGLGTGFIIFPVIAEVEGQPFFELIRTGAVFIITGLIYKINTKIKD